VVDALKMILVGRSLTEILTSIATLIEAHSDGMPCSIFLVEEDGLDMRYAPLRIFPSLIQMLPMERRADPREIPIESMATLWRNCGVATSPDNFGKNIRGLEDAFASLFATRFKYACDPFAITTPLSYFQELRVERAVHLLKTTQEGVEEIAARVGYSDGVTLRLLLRRHLGHGVKEIRRRTGGHFN
jgi:AraC-like DNA-binding protein